MKFWLPYVISWAWLAGKDVDAKRRGSGFWFRRRDVGVHMTIVIFR